MSEELKFDVKTHFQFGANWEEYSRSIREIDIKRSETALCRLLGVETLKGQSFLDIGCGSGIHSLAALRLGADSVQAIDIDERSVACAQELVKTHWDKPNFDAEVGNVFELDAARSRRYDVVYSWGVLHHTGDMWGAVDAAAKQVQPGGLFAIALYRKTPCCGFWKIEKKFFAGASPTVRKLLVYTYAGMRMLGDLVRLKDPTRRWRRPKSASRGMKWYTDVVDWLGGYPYESATPDEVREFVEARGFKQLASFKTKTDLGVFGSGNAEYRFRAAEHHEAP